MRDTRIPDQRQEWDAIYGVAAARFRTRDASAFAREVVGRFPARACMLELGCGQGRDARFFAEAGHRVIATDFSEAVMAANRKQHGNVSNLAFVIADTSSPLPFASKRFDAVYASLSLHYFVDETTRRIFEEIAGALKPGGLLCFVCKSTEDPSYGQGERIEEDMYLKDGHVRHFFSEAYARACLAGDLEAVEIASRRAEVDGEPAGVIQVIARCRS